MRVRIGVVTRIVIRITVNIRVRLDNSISYTTSINTINKLIFNNNLVLVLILILTNIQIQTLGLVLLMRITWLPYTPTWHIMHVIRTYTSLGAEMRRHKW